jgi:acyl-CoA reductase-like NAD-dependent aldehyde dehydrogenase
MHIGGRFRSAADGRTHPTYDPASGELITNVAISSFHDVDEAVTNAKEAFVKSWRPMAPAARARILYRVAELLRRDTQKFATIESIDSGKPMREAIGDVETSARYFEYYAGIADKLQGVSIPLNQNLMSFSVYDPIGVTAHIIPWNFPLVTVARGVAPALAAGSVVVVKPAEQTPLTALMLAKIMLEAGLPAGAYNVVTGPGRETGQALISHKDVSHVTFTGSVATGKHVMKSAADHIASVTLELGGKSPIVVLNDADLPSAIDGIMQAIFTNAGQVCSAGSRLIVERDLADRLLAEVCKRAKSMTFGRGIDNPMLGPLISPEQRDKVVAFVDAARSDGSSILTGGEKPVVKGLEGGWFFEPTLIQCQDPKNSIVQEEIFGPVLAVQIASDVDHAIALANGTQYGLVAGIYTSSISKALLFARDVEAGQVFINKFFAGGVETPFGGVKNSGFGREKGLEALRNYVYCKTVTAAL